MMVTAAAATSVAQAPLAGGRRDLANAHNNSVAKEPHVPGPGFKRPTPKNVATSVAQSGARPAGEVAGAGGESIKLHPRLQGYPAARLRRRRQRAKRLHIRRSPRSEERRAREQW